MATPPQAPIPPPEFARTLEAARRGDAGAIEELFRRYYPRVEVMVHRDLSRDLRRSRPWLATRFSTGDVVQEVFKDLLRNLDSFRGNSEGAFCGYLAMVVRNRLLDAVRFHQAAQRDGRRTAPMSEDRDPTSPHRGPGTDAVSDDEARQLAEVLATFPEREQLLLRARLEQGVLFQDLADRLGFPSKWAARRTFYAAQAKLVIRLGQRSSKADP
jgi:RNA polymerase sigma factor (sigma-70 family)